jgi:antirestriction protein ArdC
MPRRTTLTEDERERRRAADREFVQQAVAALRSSEGWQRWLATRRHFRSYSLRNQLLIALQKPDATRVAGFKAWLALGYGVRRGEQALRIFAPCPPSKARLQAWRDAGADPAEKPHTYFRLTAVFDRSQVDELPPPTEPAPLDPPTAPEINGDALEPWLQPLTTLAAEIGSSVSFEPIAGGADGFYRPNTKAIVVEAAHSPNRRVKTLIHELAHALVRSDRQDDDPKLDGAAEELVAETVAYCVCASSGFDPGEYSITYLASWSERAPSETIECTAALIDRLSRRIEDVVAQVEPGGSTSPTTDRQSGAAAPPRAPEPRLRSSIAGITDSNMITAPR